MILIAVYAHIYWARSVLAQFLRRIAARAAIVLMGANAFTKPCRAKAIRALPLFQGHVSAWHQVARRDAAARAERPDSGT